MPAISLRLPDDLDARLSQEVARRKTTKTLFVQELLRQALAPRNPVDLLYAARAEFGLPGVDDESVPQTDRSQHVKALVRAHVQSKHGRETDIAMDGVIDSAANASAAGLHRVAEPGGEVP